MPTIYFYKFLLLFLLVLVITVSCYRFLLLLLFLLLIANCCCFEAHFQYPNYEIFNLYLHFITWFRNTSVSYRGKVFFYLKFIFINQVPIDRFEGSVLIEITGSKSVKRCRRINTITHEIVGSLDIIL